VKPEYVRGNTLTLLRSGHEYFRALEAAIGAARCEIFLETYIYASDATATRITTALVDAAGRGVAVQVLVDGFGARNMAPALRDALRAAGVRLQVYGPDISPLTLRRRRLRRMHRKLCAIDGCVAFVGGINIVDDFDAYSPDHPRYDLAIGLEGPLAARVRAEMKHLWLRVARMHLNRSALRIPPPPALCPPCGDVEAALVVRDNVRHRIDIERAYLTAIAAARAEIILANAYFFPGRPFRQALIAAARRGVRVVLLLQAVGDHPLQTYAARAFYGVLLEAGVEIHEYHLSALHAKVAVIDERWATVGSSNVDPFSLLLAREANIVTEHPPFAAALRSALRSAVTEGARPVLAETWGHRPWLYRVRTWVAYGVVRLMMRLAGYGQVR
jgi:cardiolipin synthase A/B